MNNSDRMRNGLMGGVLLAACATATQGETEARTKTLEIGDVIVVATLHEDVVVTEVYDAELDDVLFEDEQDFVSSANVDMALFEAATVTYRDWAATATEDDHVPPPDDCWTIVNHECLQEFCSEACDSITERTCAKIAVRACQEL